MHIFFNSDPTTYKLFRLAFDIHENDPVPNVWKMNAAIERYHYVRQVDVG